MSIFIHLYIIHTINNIIIILPNPTQAGGAVTAGGADQVCVCVCVCVCVSVCVWWTCLCVCVCVINLCVYVCVRVCCSSLVSPRGGGITQWYADSIIIIIIIIIKIR